MSETAHEEVHERERGALALGRLSAWAIVALSAAYVGTGAIWLVRSGSPTLTPGDPWLAVLETLLLVSTPFLALLAAAIHGVAPRAARPHTRAALAFMLVAVALTSSIHFLDLVVLRRLSPEARVALAPLAGVPWRWPSLPFALDLFAWDVWFGLALLFAAPAFAERSAATIRRTLRAAGGLCVAGTLGPATGDLRFQLLAIAGYAGVFPVACVLLGRWFDHRARDGARGTG